LVSPRNLRFGDRFDDVGHRIREEEERVAHFTGASRLDGDPEPDRFFFFFQRFRKALGSGDIDHFDLLSVVVDAFESVADGQYRFVFDDEVGVQKVGQLANDCLPDFRGQAFSASFVEKPDFRTSVVVLNGSEIQKPFDDYGRYGTLLASIGRVFAELSHFGSFFWTNKCLGRHFCLPIPASWLLLVVMPFFGLSLLRCSVFELPFCELQLLFFYIYSLRTKPKT